MFFFFLFWNFFAINSLKNLFIFYFFIDTNELKFLFVVSIVMEKILRKMFPFIFANDFTRKKENKHNDKHDCLCLIQNGVWIHVKWFITVIFIDANWWQNQWKIVQKVTTYSIWYSNEITRYAPCMYRTDNKVLKKVG